MIEGMEKVTEIMFSAKVALLAGTGRLDPGMET